MRKIIAVLTSVLIVFSLVTCEKNEEKQPLPEESIVSDSPAFPMQGAKGVGGVPSGKGNLE